MPIELDISQTYDARIRVVGVGGGGGNAVRTMITRGLDGVEFVAANTDRQSLMSNPAGVKIQLGKEATRGLGAGANPEMGRKAVEESIDDIRDAITGSDMIFVTAGMGGGTGTGAAPVIARVGRELGALVVGIVTKPFKYESKRREQIAEHGIKELREHVDALIVIPNQRILSIVDENVSFVDALAMVDTVLYNATKGIADIISGVGFINVDFADVRTVMSNMGESLMGIGTARGEHRALEAAQNALNSPILEGMQIYGAKGLLVNVTGGSSLGMHEVNEAVSCIEQAAGDDVNLINGVVIDDRMGDEISITVVATGFRRTEDARKTTMVSVATSISDALPSEEEKSRPRITVDEDPENEIVRPVRIEILSGIQDVDVNDVDAPALYRKSKRVETEDSNSEYNVRTLPQVGQPRAAVPTSGGIKSKTDSEADASKSGFLTPKAKQAGASGGTPAFLRKIMD
ncbi:MAG: cell division protein FtsZ [Ignavibacteria bacterium]|nr:cell division protein FtsZ [Ignavibacteria bacterium]